MNTLCAIPSAGSPLLDTVRSAVDQTYAGADVWISVAAPQAYDADPLHNKFANIEHHRNAVRRQFLSSDREWLWFLDDDVVPPSDALERLLSSGHPIVGGWYPMRHGAKWVAGKWIADHTMHVYGMPLAGLTQVSWIGLGCALIHRQVLEAVQFRAGTDRVAWVDGQERYLGDCVSFANSATDAGYDLYMDGAVICAHHPL